MLAVVGLVALTARVLYLLVVQDRGLFFGLFLDSRHYADQAALIRAGHGIGGHPYLFSPSYPYFLALFTSGGGELSVHAVRAVQAAFGAATAVLTALIGSRIGGRAAGWIAGLLAALYGPFIHTDSMILVTALQTFFFTLALWLVLEARESPLRWFGVGLALGAAVILRPTGLAIAAAVVAVLLLRRCRRQAMLFCGALILMILPFTVRNVVQAGEWVLLSANGGVNFWVGNRAGASGLYRLPPGTDFVNDPLSKRNAEVAAGRSLGYREASRWWSKQAIEDIRRAPLSWLRLMSWKVAYFLHPKEISQLGSSFHWYRDRAWPLRFPIDARWLFVLAALAVFARRRLSPEGLFWSTCFLLVYIAGICLFFVTGRHRSPIMPIPIVLASGTAVGLWSLVRTGERQQRLRLVVSSLVALVVLGGASHWLYHDRDAPFYVSEVTGNEERHQGMALFDAGRYDEAAEAYRKALEIKNDYITRNNLANALKGAGRIEEAEREYRESLRLNPAWALAWYNYGVLLHADLARFADAERALENAIRHAPLMPEPYFRLGRLYSETSRPQEAIEALEQCIRLAPPNSPLQPRARSLIDAARAATGP